jgi:peroxiredoxin
MSTPFALRLHHKIYALLLLAFVLIGLSGCAVSQGVDFELEGIDGKTYRLSDYRGQWVIVNYWATWCPPCIEEMPELQHFHDKYNASSAVVIGVNHEFAELADLQNFAAEHGISFPLVRSRPDFLGVDGPIAGLPTTYVIDPKGQIAAKQIGMVSMQMLEDFISTY